jgi:hypothetical protein
MYKNVTLSNYTKEMLSVKWEINQIKLELCFDQICIECKIWNFIQNWTLILKMTFYEISWEFKQ